MVARRPSRLAQRVRTAARRLRSVLKIEPSGVPLDSVAVRSQLAAQ